MTGSQQPQTGASAVRAGGDGPNPQASQTAGRRETVPRARPEVPGDVAFGFQGLILVVTGGAGVWLSLRAESPEWSQYLGFATIALSALAVVLLVVRQWAEITVRAAAAVRCVEVAHLTQIVRSSWVVKERMDAISPKKPYRGSGTGKPLLLEVPLQVLKLSENLTRTLVQQGDSALAADLRDQTIELRDALAEQVDPKDLDPAVRAAVAFAADTVHATETSDGGATAPAEGSS